MSMQREKPCPFALVLLSSLSASWPTHYLPSQPAPIIEESLQPHPSFSQKSSALGALSTGSVRRGYDIEDLEA
jgi:hypothetical protein